MRRKSAVVSLFYAAQNLSRPLPTLCLFLELCDARLTHILTHYLKKRGGDSGAKRVKQNIPPSGKRPRGPKTAPWALLLHFRNQQVAGSSPASSSRKVPGFVETGYFFVSFNVGQVVGQGVDPRGDRAMYCERIAPGEESKTCREAGARAVFEKKLQDEDTWKLYKRACKKYYARVMKGNMSREDFNAWVKVAAGQRDITLLLLEGAKSAVEKAGLIERLREELNRD